MLLIEFIPRLHFKAVILLSTAFYGCDFVPNLSLECVFCRSQLHNKRRTYNAKIPFITFQLPFHRHRWVLFIGTEEPCWPPTGRSNIFPDSLENQSSKNDTFQVIEISSPTYFGLRHALQTLTQMITFNTQLEIFQARMPYGIRVHICYKEGFFP